MSCRDQGSTKPRHRPHQTRSTSPSRRIQFYRSAKFNSLLVYDDHELPYLPKSPTGQSVISMSYLLIYSEKELKLYKAKKLGELNKKIIRDLLAALPTVRKLSRQDRNLAIDGLKAV